MGRRVNDLDTLTRRLHAARRRLDTEAGQARHVAQTGARLQAEISRLKADTARFEKAAAVLASITEQRQADAQARIESLVTLGLHTIFGPDLSFHLVPATRAKTPVVDFVVRSTMDGQPIDTPVMDARGGGLAATVGFLLRLVIILLSKDRHDTVLFLDETFAHLSAEYEPRMAEFLRELADRTGVQIILVTHSDAYSDAADVRYRFALRDGQTHVVAV